MPVYKQSCTFCPDRVAVGDKPFCASCCPTDALAFGDDADLEGDFCKAYLRCKDKHYHIFEFPAHEGTLANIVYATKE